MTVPSAPSTFRETFCAQYGVAVSYYGEIVLRLTLYPHARWLTPLQPPALLTPDLTFVAGVGRLTRWQGFEAEVRAFRSAPENHRFWRETLRIRVSVARMRVLFSEVMGAATTGVASPCPSSDPGGRQWARAQEVVDSTAFSARRAAPSAPGCERCSP